LELFYVKIGGEVVQHIITWKKERNESNN